MDNIWKSFEDLNNIFKSDNQVVSESFKKALKDSDTSDQFYKSWSTDLKEKFPNGDWKTVNGAKVFINGGKVIAGLEGFNGEIDKFFKEKETKKATEKSPKEKLTDLKEQSKKLRGERDKELEELRGTSKFYPASYKHDQKISEVSDEILKLTKEIYTDPKTGKLDYAAIAKDSGTQTVESDGKDNIFGMQAQLALREIASHITNSKFNIKNKELTWNEIVKQKMDHYIDDEDFESKIDLDRAKRIFPSLNIEVNEGSLSVSSKKGDGNMTLPLKTLTKVSEDIDKYVKKNEADTGTNVSGSYNRNNALYDLVDLKKKGVQVSQITKDIEELKKHDPLKKEYENAQKEYSDYQEAAREIRETYNSASIRKRYNDSLSASSKKRLSDIIATQESEYQKVKTEYDKLENEEKSLRNKMYSAGDKYRAAIAPILDKPEYKKVDSKGRPDGNHLQNIVDNMKKDVNLFSSTVDLLANKELKEENKTNKRGLTKAQEKLVKDYQKQFDNAYNDFEKVRIYEIAQNNVNSGKVSPDQIAAGKVILENNKAEYEKLKEKYKS